MSRGEKWEELERNIKICDKNYIIMPIIRVYISVDKHLGN